MLITLLRREAKSSESSEENLDERKEFEEYTLPKRFEPDSEAELEPPEDLEQPLESDEPSNAVELEPTISIEHPFQRG